MAAQLLDANADVDLRHVLSRPVCAPAALC
jgi:hypothetical protein